jgi:general secretion pathway protein D
LLKAMVTDTKTKVRQSPQIRASDGQKAQLNIGDRIPYATGSFQPGVGSVGVSPLVQTQFNFVDTGVNVDITPYVHSADEVTLHVDINVSTVRDRIDLGGVSQPIIGQRKAVADIRLREGEVSILGGLTQITDSQTVNGIPGLVNIPILGKLFFGSQSIEKDRAQLMIALIPHIVRTPDYTSENVRGIGVGNDSTVRLNYAPREPAAAPAPVAPAGGPQVPPGPAQPEGPKPPVPMAVPSITQPQTPGPTSIPGATSPVPGVPPPIGGVPPAAASSSAAPTAGDAAKVSFVPGTLQAQMSGVVGVNLQLENVKDLFAVTSLKLKFDPAVLKLNDVTPGELITREGGRVTSVKEIHNETGEALLTVTRLEGSKGVTGSGALATLNFIAVGKGSTKVQVTELGLKNTQSVTVAAALGELPVTVQ